MTGTDLLQTLAEVGITLAGFTGIVAVLGRRGHGEWEPHEWLRLAMLLTFSFGSVFFAFLPPLLDAYDVPEPRAWSIASAMLAVFLAVVYAAIIGRVVALGELVRDEFPRWAGAVTGIGTAIVVAVLASNAFGARAFGPYLVGMLWMLVAAALQFYRLLRH
jgi:hypothetical protein